MNVEQGSPEWFEARKGRMTASHAQAIGNAGKGLETYIVQIMAEVYSSGDNEKPFFNSHTDRGNELEPIARAVYEMETGNAVHEVGFIEYGDYAGCSPDGLVGDEGGIEIKSIDNVGYFKHILNGQKEVDSKHEWQVQMNLLVTGRKWWDLVLYNPNYKKSMFVYRYGRNEAMREALIEGIEIGAAAIGRITKKMQENGFDKA